MDNKSEKILSQFKASELNVDNLRKLIISAILEADQIIKQNKIDDRASDQRVTDLFFY